MRAVVVKALGGPEVLDVEEVAQPHAGPGQLRVRITAAGLNPMDWVIVADERRAAAFGIRPPTGFGSDFAGVVDEVGDGVDGFARGDRVFGGAGSRAVADYVVLDPGRDAILPTPDGLDDVTAGVLPVAGATASAALAAIDVRAGDTVLVGGAAGGVGCIAVQLARLAGARVIGTASEGSFDFVRGLGAEPVRYGDGLVERVKAAAPDGITAAMDLFGTETAYAAMALNVDPDRVSTIAARDPQLSAKAVSGWDAQPGALRNLADQIAQGRLTVPIAARYPIERIREAVTLQASRHVHGKVVIVL